MRIKTKNNELLNVLYRIKDSVVALDNNCNITYANKAYADIFNLESSAMIGKNIWELLPKIVGTIIYKNINEAMKEKKVRRFEWEGVYSNGFWETTIFPSDEGMTIINKDITKRKKAEDALRESEERFSKAFNAGPTAMAIQRFSDGRFVDVNERFLRMFEYGKEEVIGHTPTELNMVFDPEQQVKFHVPVNRSSMRYFETVNRSKSGKLVIVMVSTEIISLNGKRHYLSTIVDITESKKAQEALDKERLMLKGIIENTGAMIAYLDSNFNFIMVNSAYANGSGYTVDALIGKNHFTLFPNTENQAIFEEVKDTGQPIKFLDKPFEFANQPHRGVTYWDWTLTPIKDNAGKVQGLILTLMETTERKQLQKKLEDYTKNLEKMVEERTKQLKNAERLAAIGQTAGMVGHDIRNPLQAMISDVYLLKSDLVAMPECATKEDVRESLDSIEKNIGYVNKIVADLQDYARVLHPECVEVDLPDLIVSVFQTVSIPDTIKLSINVKTLAKIKTDPTFIRRALTNLVNNAIQAMSNDGRLELAGFQKKDKVYITVSDTGVGIPEEIKPKLFTPMMTTKAKGQGLGLAVVKRLVEALNGTITFESEEGKGTKFTIELPLDCKKSQV